ncbi:MAG: hypothetical protein ACXAEN_23460 [Candidatus Thorarchaeota archaeon]|jgi:hypothetical protein
MATILNGDIQVDFLNDNRQKRLSWLGGTNDSYTMNEIYSAMATLLDETTTIDDGTCFSAETPVEYTIGKIDTGDTEPWYITFDLMEHITGGALRTTGWLRAEGSNTGIIVVPVTSGGAIVAADEGNDIVMDTDGDTGTLLEVIDTGGAIDYLVVRPDSSAAANSFDNTPTSGDTMTCNAHQSTQSSASTTGEQIWANLYSLGTIDSNVHLYLYQGDADVDASRVRLFSWNDATQDWYGNGHIDIVVALKDITASTWSVIDDGFITVFARKYGDLYASFEVATSTTSGGRNPIPLQTAADLDNTTGIKIVTTGSFSGGPFTVGEIISAPTSGARGIVTDQVADTSITYIPIDDPQEEFHSGGAELITGASSGATATTSASPTDTGPAAAAWFSQSTVPTISFTYTTADIDDDASDENYGITIDCKSNLLTEVYEWVKYATRNGETTNDLDGINGERYIGGEVYLAWSGDASGGTISEGDDVTQTTSGATGVVVAFDDTANVMLLRDTRGDFDTASAVTSTEGSGAITPTTAVTFAPKTSSPLGTFAGGTFFGARGVLLINYHADDANSFILTPIEGGTKERPQTFSMVVSNLVGGAATEITHDRVAIFRLDGDGGNIDKTEHDCTGGEAAGANTITVDVSIDRDVVGKTTGGTLVLVDDPTGSGDEYKIRFASWSGAVFTLNEITGTAESGTNTTTLVDNGATFTDGADQVYRGDLVYVAGKGWAYVKSVDSDIQLTLETAIAGFTATDGYEINVPPVAITSADQLYVPFMDRIATAATESVAVVYLAQIFYRAKVRNTRAAIKIKPFSVDGSTTGSNVAVATIRTQDTIIT